jgi:hypothetical protein
MNLLALLFALVLPGVLAASPVWAGGWYLMKPNIHVDRWGPETPGVAYCRFPLPEPPVQVALCNGFRRWRQMGVFNSARAWEAAKQRGIDEAGDEHERLYGSTGIG